MDGGDYFGVNDGQTRVIPGQKSACRKFHHIRACVPRTITVYPDGQKQASGKCQLGRFPQSRLLERNDFHIARQNEAARATDAAAWVRSAVLVLMVI
jgi:hypothetical protein